MSLSDIVSVSITTVSTVLARAGFGVALILSANMTGVARTAECTSLADVDAVAGISTSSPEYRMASVLFSQARKPTKVILGRLVNKPTLVYTIKVPTAPTTGVVNSTAYQFKVTAPNIATEQTVDFTSDGTASNEEIIDGLKTAFDALSIVGITSSTTGAAGTKKLVLTAGTAGTLFGVRIPAAQRVLLWSTPSAADAGFADDLTAIRAENDTWYALLNPWSAGAYSIAVSLTIEAISDSKKIYITRSNDTDVIQAGSGGSSDFAGFLTSNRERTAGFYSDYFDSFIDAAAAGLLLPATPGSETWAFKTLSGPSVDTLTSTNRTNALAVRANVYTSIAGVPVTQMGTTFSGQYIDVVRGRDWLSSRLAEDVFELLASLLKVPFTDSGIALVENAVRGVLQEAVDVGLLASSPAFVVTVPRAASVSSANKALRLLPDVNFTATLSGAIHKVTIAGTISV